MADNQGDQVNEEEMQGPGRVLEDLLQLLANPGGQAIVMVIQSNPNAVQGTYEEIAQEDAHLHESVLERHSDFIKFRRQWTIPNPGRPQRVMTNFEISSLYSNDETEEDDEEANEQHHFMSLAMQSHMHHNGLCFSIRNVEEGQRVKIKLEVRMMLPNSETIASDILSGNSDTNLVSQNQEICGGIFSLSDERRTDDGFVLQADITFFKH